MGGQGRRPGSREGRGTGWREGDGGCVARSKVSTCRGALKRWPGRCLLLVGACKTEKAKSGKRGGSGRGGTRDISRGVQEEKKHSVAMETRHERAKAKQIKEDEKYAYSHIHTLTHTHTHHARMSLTMHTETPGKQHTHTETYCNITLYYIHTHAHTYIQTHPYNYRKKLRAIALLVPLVVAMAAAGLWFFRAQHQRAFSHALYAQLFRS